MAVIAAFCASAIFHANCTGFQLVISWRQRGWTSFSSKGVFVFLELWLGVARWHPARAHTWTVIVVIGCSPFPLCVEPILRTHLIDAYHHELWTTSTSVGQAGASPS
jgi:hypothetical protein